MTLSAFIRELGDQAAADLFGVKVRTVQSWRRLERYPRPEQSWVIVAKSEGRVDYAGIFGPHGTAANSDAQQAVA